MTTTSQDRMRFAAIDLANAYLDMIKKDIEPILLAEWIIEQRWILWDKVDDSRRNPEKVLTEIEDIARSTIKYQLKLDKRLADKLRKMRNQQKKQNVNI